MSDFKAGDIISMRPDMDINELGKLPNVIHLNHLMVGLLKEHKEFTIRNKSERAGRQRGQVLSLSTYPGENQLLWAWDSRFFVLAGKGVTSSLYVDEDII